MPIQVLGTKPKIPAEKAESLFDGLDELDETLINALEQQSAVTAGALEDEFLNGPIDIQPGAREVLRSVQPAGAGGTGALRPAGMRPNPNTGPSKISDPQSPPSGNDPLVPPGHMPSNTMTVPAQPALNQVAVEEDDVDPLEALLFFYLEIVPYPTDEQMHSLAASLGLRKERLEEKVYRMLKEAMKFPSVQQRVLSSVEDEDVFEVEEEADSHTDEGWEHVEEEADLLTEEADEIVVDEVDEEEATADPVDELVDEEEEAVLDPTPVATEETLCEEEVAEPVDPLVDPVGDDQLIMNDGAPEGKGDEKLAQDIELDGIPDVKELDDNFGNTP